ncbi:MAG: hypothetical protein LBK75_00340 [Oscillospiraceae bacterium]|nr:hypothetical protein [Oscillospiraceae bacterium]
MAIFVIAHLGAFGNSVRFAARWAGCQVIFPKIFALFYPDHREILTGREKNGTLATETEIPNF